jgi:hypothetical protein
MAIPLLVYAAAPVVARYIAKKGIGAAIKKFTKKAINEGKKHADDVFKKNGGKTAEKAANIKKMRPVQNASTNNRITMRRAGATGIGIGTAGTALSMKGDKAKPKPSSTTTKGKSENPRNKNKVNKGMPKASASKQVNPKDFPTYKKDTKSAGSFRAATTAAKKAGKKTFTWEGRKYSTKEK